MDDTNYELTELDFQFLEIGEEDAWACVNRDTPLGIPTEMYEYFVGGLFEALFREGLDDADVRLQGSSISFFSNMTKRYPETPDSRVELFLNENGRLPSAMEIRRFEAKHRYIWESKNPGQRPFDSLHVIGISPEPSDIDVQISSNVAFEIAKEIARARGIAPHAVRFDNPSYNFLIKEISDNEFLYLLRWSTFWTSELKRGVNIAIFDRNGPPKRATGISSHLRDTDWVLVDMGASRG